MTQQSVIFIGRYASGKGTQAELLIKALKEIDHSRSVLYMQPGQEFRDFMQGNSYTAILAKGVIEKGELMPEFMPIYIWTKMLIEQYTGNEHLVFDGCARKLLEAKTLDSIFPFYGLEKPWVIYLDVEHEEAHNRLKIRSKSSGRADDGAVEIENRRRAHEEFVIPVIEHYRTSPLVRFLDIDGERTIEEIHNDIVKKIGLK